MAQLCTATFITDSGFATGLSPTVTINEALTGNLKGTFTMTESSVGNYIYYWNDGDENIVYFFKFDAGDDEVINRYEGNTNKVETAITTRGGGGSVIYNNQITKEKMKQIAEMVVEMLPEQKEIVLDTSKIEEKLVIIEDKIELKDIEIDYDIILSSQDKNTQKIIKKIDTIKIPKFDDSKIVESIKKVGEKEIDLSPMKDVCAKVDEMTNTMNKESKAIKTLNSVKEQLKSIEDEVEETTSIIQPQEEILDKKHIEELLKD